MSSSKIKVLIVDDSAVVRQTLTEILESDPDIEVISTASDPFVAVQKIRKQQPDVITLDIEMPRMDGLSFLQKIMTQHPIPVVIISSLAEKNTATALKALDYGAVDIIAKPQLGIKDFLFETQIRVCDKVKAASMVSVTHKRTPIIQPKMTSADAIIPRSPKRSMLKTTEKIVAVGASTGGTEALRILLEDLPLDSPGIVIVQHMPEIFTRSFADRLNQICKIDVKEAANNDRILTGRALIAPGNRHMLVRRSGANYYVEIKDAPFVNRHRPSVDVLFKSTARYVGSNAIGVIMTGMGSDGAKGMLEMKEAGSDTAAQDEQTSVVFGMPLKAIELGGVDKILPLNKLADFIIDKSKQERKK